MHVYLEKHIYIINTYTYMMKYIFTYINTHHIYYMKLWKETVVNTRRRQSKKCSNFIKIIKESPSTERLIKSQEHETNQGCK